MPDIKIGMSVSGKVVGVFPFGVFVDIGLTDDALIDLACMDNPEKGFPKLGETVTAVIVAINNNCIRLSTRSEHVQRD